MNKVIAVDFDGTLCKSAWPDIGEANDGPIEWLKDCRKNGDKVILYTCREKELLTAALMWCMRRGLEFDAVNRNLPERIEQYGVDCRKISADIYLDDRAIGVFYPPKQSNFYVQGTKGWFMQAEVGLNSQETTVREEHGASDRNDGGKKAQPDKNTDAYGLPVGFYPADPYPDGSHGYQYRPGKPALSARIREAWRVLRGRTK